MSIPSDALDVANVQKQKAPKQSRLEISEEVKEGIKGAARTAILALDVASRAPQNMLYLGALSVALTEFMKIRDEVKGCKCECKASIADTRQIRALIKKFWDKWNESGKGEGSLLNESLREAFAKFERIVLECIIATQTCKHESMRRKDRVRLYLTHSETDLAKSVKDCASKMGAALYEHQKTAFFSKVAYLRNQGRLA
ncbi:hypothetical protein PENSPDRAFT_757593 [Peniophora sp. CONT]|nr:hypothetical protein PENSPDRAFT_757593 [Peniophora sp. CONT]